MINNVNAYRKSFETISKTKQVVMLYDSAISAVYQAKTAIEQQNFQERYNNLERAFLIVSGLKNCLDHENAVELSKTLHDWYSALEMKILNINSSNSIEECESSITHLKKMREAWVEVDAQYDAAQQQNNQYQEPVISSAEPATITDYAYNSAKAKSEEKAEFAAINAAAIIQGAALSLSA